jgi:multidrug efflux pump subunit AcrA (membrane-fusion protein)
MKISRSCFLFLFVFASCGKKVVTVQPKREGITESVYASGIIKSQNQYQVFATVSGIIQHIYVQEGDTIKRGAPLMAILNETSTLVRENAQLAADLADYTANAGRLSELRMQIDLAQNKMLNDSLLWARQSQLWSRQIGSKTELERAELAYQNAKTSYETARIRYTDEKRRLDITSRQALKNLQISKTTERDFVVTSKMNGRVYQILKEEGEIVSPQIPLAVIGDASTFTLELQIDEYDITRIEPDQKALITMDSYKGEVFEALVTRINPIMNERTKTFLAEARFVTPPPTLYPNLTLEANIIIRIKPDALTVPRSFIMADKFVIRENGDTVSVKIGVKDYQKAEILEGITEQDVLIQPGQ